jgi:4-hydroxybenzoate polyprenyltransferase
VSAPAQQASAATAVPDAHAAGFWSWLWSLLPADWMPFIQLARLDRPTGWQLLLAPCLASSCLATIYHLQSPAYGQLVLFCLGAIAMRGAGSTFNDLIDRKIDAQVERTRSRPLPSGRVSPLAAALFMAAQALIGLGVLLSLNRFAIVLGLCSLLPVAIYPFMKRFTSWPQAILGLAFSWGALMGWAAVAGALAAPALWLYASCVVWTIGYDTIYALQDRKDDVRAGVKSTALLFGDHVIFAVALLYLATVVLAELALIGAGAGLLAQLGLLAFALHLVWQLRKLDDADEAMALKLFRSNGPAGFLLFAGLLADNMLFYFIK